MRSINGEQDRGESPPDDDVVVDLGAGPDELGPTMNRHRSRLAVVAAFLALFHLVFVVAKLFGPPSGPAGGHR